MSDTVHNLDIWEEPFKAIEAGMQTALAVLVKDYQVGDLVRLHELAADNYKLTGRTLTVLITHSFLFKGHNIYSITKHY